MRYVPAGIEREWFRNVSRWQSTYCESMRPYLKDFTTVVSMIKRNTSYPEQLFSSFKYSYQCGSTIVRYSHVIEPLVGGLRHPLSMCKLQQDPKQETNVLLSRDYILLEPHPAIPERRSHFLFDLGASTFLAGKGGSSQKLLVDSYAANGIRFDRIFLWEPEAVDPKSLYGELPPELYASYQVGHPHFPRPS
jgi:hypothetical protein